MDDPIFIQISDLEQHDGKPADFEKVQRAMMNGKNGAFRLQDAIRSIAKGDLQDGVVLTTMPSTYYYASINDSVYSFAFNLADSDKEYRRAASPAHRGAGAINFFSNLLAYNTSEVVQVCAVSRCVVLHLALLRLAVLCCWAVLFCAVLYCAALCCAVLCSAVVFSMLFLATPCCTTLRCAVLCYIALRCAGTMLRCAVLYICTVSCCAVLYICTVSCCAVLRCVVLRFAVLYTTVQSIIVTITNVIVIPPMIFAT